MYKSRCTKHTKTHVKLPCNSNKRNILCFQNAYFDKALSHTKCTENVTAQNWVLSSKVQWEERFTPLCRWMFGVIINAITNKLKKYCFSKDRDVIKWWSVNIINQVDSVNQSVMNNVKLQ